jgi:hypothetical protein
VAEKWSDMQIEQLAVGDDGRALKAVGLGLRDPRLAGLEDRWSSDPDAVRRMGGAARMGTPRLTRDPAPRNFGVDAKMRKSPSSARSSVACSGVTPSIAKRMGS